MNQLPVIEPATAEGQFLCPDEPHPISRSVHLARLAAFYPKCRKCRHRQETGQISQHTLERLESTQCRVARPSLFAAEGVRGVYLNELTRKTASELAAGLAALLWESMPLVGRSGSLPAPAAPRAARPGPAVVVGYDERPASPDIVTGAAAGLRRMGCQVIDVGLTTRSCFAFAVDHLQAAAGVFVTGAGSPPAWTGLDLFGRGARPMSLGSGLEHVEIRSRQTCPRPTRQAGRQRTFRAIVPYEAGLWKHFHALRPLKVCCATSIRIVTEIVRRLFERLPCQVQLLGLPQRSRNLADPGDADVAALASMIATGRFDLGILIDDDSQRVALLDERGQLIASGDATRVLGQFLLEEQRAGVVALETAAMEQNASDGPLAGRYVDGGRTYAEMDEAMREHAAVFGGGDGGSFWFREAYPASDAIVTLGKVLQALSRSDDPFSQVVARHGRRPRLREIVPLPAPG